MIFFLLLFFFFIRFGLPFIVRVLRELSYENLQAAILKAMSRILLDNLSSQVRVIQLLRGKFLWSEKSAVACPLKKLPNELQKSLNFCSEQRKFKAT